MSNILSIGFAGPDAVGKSEMARRTAVAIGGFCVADADLGLDWRADRKRVNVGHDVEARFNYFLAFNAEQKRIAQEISQSGYESGRRIGLFETTSHRTVATHRVLGSLAAHIVPFDHLKPDVTFLLVLSEEERLARWMRRDGGLVFPSHWDETLYERSEQVWDEFRSFGLPELDASLPPDRLVATVREQLGL